MNAYLILEFQVTDRSLFMEYVEKIPPHIQKHGGKYLVEGTQPKTIEGNWSPERLVILEFPTEENAHGFLQDPRVQSLFAIRHTSTKGNLIMAQSGSWKDAS